MSLYNTSSYFFPSNPQLTRKESKDEQILQVHRKEIKAYFTKNIIIKVKSKPSENSSTKPLNKTITRMSTCPKPPKIDKKIHPKKQEKSQSKNIGVYQLIQRAKKLKTQDSQMSSNPFYRILRKKIHSSLPRHTVTEISAPVDMEVTAQDKQQKNKKMVQNRIIFQAVQEQLHPQMKSQSFTYYQIKHYFQKKYGMLKRGPKASRIE